MLGGRPPFRAGSEFLVFQKIQQREFSYPQGFSDLGKDLIDKLLVNYIIKILIKLKTKKKKKNEKFTDNSFLFALNE